ncbi:NAD(P)/FAD-dependent oxidoreductase [Acidothermaceae bacterium B102]|nr:NAD(P)/FAD-dependent oxidoreductase [Acidothermaceae bacterium B102]
MRDVVIVGAGHNALVAACYLAREGLDVEVVERDTVIGGAASTVERFPGYQVDRGSSAHIMIRHTGIVEDLQLDECGLRYLDCDPWAFAPYNEKDGRQHALTFSTDLGRTCDSIARLCGDHDAEAYAAFAKDWGRRNARIFEAFQAAPTMRNLGQNLWNLGRKTGHQGPELARQFLQPGDALLDATFQDERLKTALSWLGAQAGPPTHEVATADLVGWNMVMHQLPPGRPVGGSGRLSEALAKRFLSYGGTLRLDDAATAITNDGTRVTGVHTRSGDSIQAERVLAGCHVLTTVRLLGDETLLADALKRIRVGNGIGMIVRLGTTDLPRYPSAPRDGSAHQGLQLLARDRNQLRAAYGDFSSGIPPWQPAVLAMTFSAVDPTIAPPGRHNIGLWAQWHPYQLSNGEHWDDIKEREADRIIAQVERLAPGFTETIEHRYVQSPLDIERELGLLRANVMHVEMGLDAMFSLRPVPEWSSYRGPREGLYLTGASTHPGGGVFGASGRSAALAILADRTGTRRARVARRARAALHT